jgi:glutamyl-Q tRNA(Asp) synthetase
VAKAMALTGPLTWNDTSAGTVSAQPALLGDVVVARKDVLSSYHLAVTVDDAAQEVTHIIRGRDLFEATHIHRLLQALLGLPAPIYQHHPLIFGADGNRLAKRSSALSLASLRASGMEGRALADQLRNGHLPFGFALQEG